MSQKRVLIIYYSFTSQTKRMLDKFVCGLEAEGVEVTLQRIIPRVPYEFPFRTYRAVFTAAVKTFFRQRMSIEPISNDCYGDWDKIIIAGPTWSYFPSGPILDFIDRFGEDVCAGHHVTPFISCRSFWRLNFWYLRRRLKKYVADVENPIVFAHPGNEPWRTIALVLVLKGEKVGSSNSLLGRHFRRYGHNKEQRLAAKEKGREFGKSLNR